MKLPLVTVQLALDALSAASGDRDVEGMCPTDLIAVNDALGFLRRTVDAAMLPIAAEIARQSRSELGKDSLAKKQGFGSVGKMISTTTGTSVGEAIRLVAVGEAITPRVLLNGEPAPAKHRYVAAALDGGSLGTLAASAIIEMLDRIALRVGHEALHEEALQELESRLVEAAPGLSVGQLRVLIARGEAALDPEGATPREEELRAQRGLTIRQERSGLIVVSGRFDPENGAPIMAAVEGIVTGMLWRRDDGASVVDADERTISQMRADAMTELCRHGVGCDSVPTGPSTTIVVRMNLDDLETGTGVGTVDGIDTPVSAATVRRMAADAQVIPCVLGSDSEILDWGRGKRLFTPAQKLALSERDGGCSFCGLPPSMTAAHHIRWWLRDAGPTDLSNGVLLCTSCHHRIHDDGWEIRIDDPGSVTERGQRKGGVTGFNAKGKVWFIPPAWLDASRTPRLGWRARYDLTA